MMVFMQALSPLSVKALLADGQEFAFLDVREAGEFGEGHPFLAIPLAYSRLEADIARLVPRLSTRIVLIDGGNGVARRAARALAALGYSDLSITEGGVAAWQAAGLVLFKGVNLPSKTFGELAEAALGTPHISAQQLQQLQASGSKLVVLDGRPLAEFNKMSIPGAISCPNGELALRHADLIPDAETTVVVNCAGRTRSIVGAQTLRDLGLPNPIYALENGTQGWYLNDLPLDHGQNRSYPEHRRAPAPEVAARLAQLSAEQGAARIDAARLSAWLADPERTTYLLDVRSPEEFAASPIAGAAHAPGGQLVQATDQYLGTRNARIVLVDTDGLRAPMTAVWLRRLGHEAYLATPDALPATPATPPAEAALPRISSATLAANLDAYDLVDLRDSASYRAGHIDAARWSIRPLLQRGDGHRATVFVTPEPALAAAAARDVGGNSLLLTEGPEQWLRAGLTVVASADAPSDAERIDYLFFVHDRHSGNKAAARAYLEWETGLLAQIDAQERALFCLG
ncbi:rhodanese-like domain-containing protein [Comamonas sp. JUb58]|uniref:rhodanese-like domain-containing protein n=1 Tax=Comamonas sp. JUb58 TaxID=2485114 RepID=UPI0010613454|nr:rhodanese-like domain-containing protein [Comamonas sp. JUb58]